MSTSAISSRRTWPRKIALSFDRGVFIDFLCFFLFFLFFVVVVSAIEYIMYLHQQRKKQEEELEALRKEVMALKIMKT